jgi:hypothetical protein
MINGWMRQSFDERKFQLRSHTIAIHDKGVQAKESYDGAAGLT